MNLPLKKPHPEGWGTKYQREGGNNRWIATKADVHSPACSHVRIIDANYIGLQDNILGFTFHVVLTYNLYMAHDREQAMLENRMVTPFADDDREMLTKPDGFKLIRDIPYYTAHEIIRDEVDNLPPDSNKSHLQKIFDDAMLVEPSRQEWQETGSLEAYCDWQIGMRKAYFAIIECATRAGESDYAEDAWLREFSE